MPLVDRLELVGDVARTSGPSAPPAAAIRSPQRPRRASSRSSWPGQGDRVARAGRRSPHSPSLVEQLLVGIDLGGDRHRAGGERLTDQARRRPRPARGGADDVGGGDQLARRSASPGRRKRTRSRRPRLIRGVATASSSIQTSASQGSVQRQPPQRPQEQPQRAALLAGAVDDPRRRALAPRRSAAAARPRRPARRTS